MLTLHVGPVTVLQGLEAHNQMHVLVKPFLYLLAFGQAAVLFGSAFGLVCWLLTISGPFQGSHGSK